MLYLSMLVNLRTVNHSFIFFTVFTRCLMRRENESLTEFRRFEMFGKKKQTQTSVNIDKLMAQLERTKRINDNMLVMSINFTKDTNKRLKEVKR